MYVTRPLSLVLQSAEILAAAPDGPNSGYLVIQDEESETYSFFDLFKNRTLTNLPFPQDKELSVAYFNPYHHHHPNHYHYDHNPLFLIPVLNHPLPNHYHYDHNPLFLIPVLNHPLSSNLYHAIVPHGQCIGEALTCSREEDKVSCLFWRCIKEEKPRPLDPSNIYQQFEIAPYGTLFEASSVALDGFLPFFLRRKGWSIHTKTPANFKLDEARGLDSQLRARLPELGSPASRVVGKWYTPFIFVKEGTLKDQVKQSMYYEVTLEQRWDRIYSCRRNNDDDDDNDDQGNSVVTDTSLEKEQVFVGGKRARWNERSTVDGVIWFKVDGGGIGVGLRVELVERMRWEERRGGWMGDGGGEEKEWKINRVEEFGGGGGWNEYGCYVLVERFNLRRMDGRLVMSYDFKHLHQLRTKWE